MSVRSSGDGDVPERSARRSSGPGSPGASPGRDFGGADSADDTPDMSRIGRGNKVVAWRPEAGPDMINNCARNQGTRR